MRHMCSPHSHVLFVQPSRVLNQAVSFAPDVGNGFLASAVAHCSLVSLSHELLHCAASGVLYHCCTALSSFGAFIQLILTILAFSQAFPFFAACCSPNLA